MYEISSNKAYNIVNNFVQYSLFELPISSMKSTSWVKNPL